MTLLLLRIRSQFGGYCKAWPNWKDVYKHPWIFGDLLIQSMNMDGNSFGCCIQMVLAIEQPNGISLVVKWFNFPRFAIFVYLGVAYIAFPQHLGEQNMNIVLSVHQKHWIPVYRCKARARTTSKVSRDEGERKQTKYKFWKRVLPVIVYIVLLDLNEQTDLFEKPYMYDGSLRPKNVNL